MSQAPRIVRTVAELRAQVAAWRSAGMRIAMVPTMGALHAGHLSLVRLGLTRADHVVASIFVNPAQFAPHEDFDAYPRGEGRDAELLGEAGCALIFAPSVSEMYPAGFASRVLVDGVSGPLEGQKRPQFFGGVATVVAKLLNQCRPDVALFGEKDYQQLLVIRRMAQDLDLGVEIVGGPTVREADGLAMSSRNAYLSAEERSLAATLPSVMAEAVERLRAGDSAEGVEAVAVARLEAAGFGPVDYVQVHDGATMERLGPGAVQAGSRVFVAAWLGKTRLIDNWAV
jgi:pantoate--beta-alanine ligase